MFKVALKPEFVKETLAKWNVPTDQFIKEVGISKWYLPKLMKQEKFPGPSLRDRLMKYFYITEDEWDILFHIVEE